jgi:hypothetical protein
MSISYSFTEMAAIHLTGHDSTSSMVSSKGIITPEETSQKDELGYRIHYDSRCRSVEIAVESENGDESSLQQNEYSNSCLSLSQSTSSEKLVKQDTSVGTHPNGYYPENDGYETSVLHNAGIFHSNYRTIGRGRYSTVFEGKN